VSWRPLNDGTETEGYYGHALGASGAIEEGICALAMTYDWLPPTGNLANADEKCDLDYIKRVGRPSCPEVILCAERVT
jgi:3-oxoacyl-[acyl-carrier-protein] synthase II